MGMLIKNNIPGVMPDVSNMMSNENSTTITFSNHYILMKSFLNYLHGHSKIIIKDQRIHFVHLLSSRNKYYLRFSRAKLGSFFVFFFENQH